MLRSALVAILALPAYSWAECTSIFHLSMIDSLPIHPNFDAMGAVSLRVDAIGLPHVAFKLYYGPVRYATLTPGGWQAETARPTAERSCCLMLDSNGDPHILFHQGILSRAGSTWSLNPHSLFNLDHAMGAMASDGATHVIVLQSFSGGVYVGQVSHVLVRGSDWIQTPLEVRNDAFTSPNASASMRLNASGVPRFCVTNTNAPEIRCWEGLDSPLASIPHARWGSLAIDSQGVTHLVYYNTQTQDLDLAVYQAGGWSITPVDTEGDVGAWASLDFDGQDGAHIAYYDNSSHDRVYAYRAPGGTRGRDAPWMQRAMWDRRRRSTWTRIGTSTSPIGMPAHAT